MIQLTAHMRILVAVEPVDFRAGIDGLCRICRKILHSDPFSGGVFVFCNRRRTALKVLVYDGQGFWICHKRLSEGRFHCEQANSLIERVKTRSLEEKDYEIVLALIQMVIYLQNIVSQKSHSIARLVRMLFGIKTESAKNVLKGSSEASGQELGKESTPEEESPKKKGHGRNGVASYPSAPRIPVPHEELKPGDPCPLCPKGKLYRMPPEVVVRMQGHAPIEVAVYELEKLRCSPCGAIFTAKLSQEAGEKKYDESAGAVIACMKYGSGFPFYRMERHQQNMGVPLAASTQWDIVEATADDVHPAYRELVRQGAQGEIFHNDDTSMRILSLAKELASEDTERKGIFTTGVVSICGGHKIALFFTGNHHAGENLRAVLKERAAGLAIALQMCDALNRNVPKDFATILSNCLTHARRNFVDVHASFPEGCGYVIEMLGKIYHHDATAKERSLSPQERLEYHRIHSGPVMDELKRWCTDQLEHKKVEPNSGLGKAIDYMLKRWDRFTLFLQIPGAPLDNNLRTGSQAGSAPPQEFPFLQNRAWRLHR